MLSDQTVDILKALFVAIADHELAIEQQRQYLARLEEFEPYATFLSKQPCLDHDLTL
jgi:hypothetical protein